MHIRPLSSVSQVNATMQDKSAISVSAQAQHAHGMNNQYTADTATYVSQLIYDFWNDGLSRTLKTNSNGEITYNVDALTADGRWFAQTALEAWSLVSPLSFKRISGEAQINFDDRSSGGFAAPFFIVDQIDHVDINVGATFMDGSARTVNSLAYQVYLHEIGHALGLGHAGNYNFAVTWGEDNRFENDTLQWSVMSYFNQEDATDPTATNARPVTPQLMDIAAIEALYGKADGVRTGDTTYGRAADASDYVTSITASAATAVTVLDQGGVDTFDFSHSKVAQDIDLRAGAFSDVMGAVGNWAIAFGTVIENAKGGSAADMITGNGETNSLQGGAGDDWLTPSRGNDYVNGGAGSDMVSFYDAHKKVSVDLSSGSATVGYDTNRLVSIENVTGSIFGDVIEGNAANNRLRGLSDADWFIGSAGADTYEGGSGNDTISYAKSSAAVDVNLSTGRASGGIAQGDRFDSIERVTGSIHSETNMTAEQGSTWCPMRCCRQA